MENKHARFVNQIYSVYACIDYVKRESNLSVRIAEKNFKARTYYISMIIDVQYEARALFYLCKQNFYYKW